MSSFETQTPPNPTLPHRPLAALQAQRAALLGDLISINTDLPLRFSDLLTTYQSSEWGQHHATQPLRFSVNYGAAADVLLSQGVDDVHPVRHMQVVHDHLTSIALEHAATPFTARSIPDPVDIAVARASSLTHEFGENTHTLHEIIFGRTIGDIPHGQKTDGDRVIEYAINRFTLESLFPHFPGWFRQRVVNVTTHQPSERESGAHRLTEVAHTWSFYATALTAGAIVLAEQTVKTTESEGMQQLTRLARTVTAAIRPEVEKFIGDFPRMEKRLEAMSDLHERIEHELAA